MLFRSEKRIEHPKEVLKEGDVVTLRVIRIEPENHRIGLSLRKVESMAYAEMDWQTLLDEANEEAPVAELATETTIEDAVQETTVEDVVQEPPAEKATKAPRVKKADLPAVVAEETDEKPENAEDTTA